jgi:hypothetical protein
MMRLLSVLRAPFSLVCGLAITFLVVSASRNFVTAQPGQATTASVDVMPRYDANRNLVLPADYRRWVLIGSSLGLSYSDGAPGEHQMFNTTLMEPSAYQHFIEKGTFREGTMFVLMGQGVGTNATPARQGQFATDLHMIEMAVKDSKRVAESWAYYDFNSPTGDFRATAAPQPKANCFNCHVEHAERDNVFVQFYSLLNDVAPKK